MSSRELARGRRVVARLPYGGDLLAEIVAVAAEHRMVMAELRAIGALQRARLSFYDQGTHEYEEFSVDEPVELVSLLGTPWEPQTEGKLLFLEDVSAKPYQIDRMLWQLREAGKLEGVRGIVFGEMLDCASPGAPPELLDQVILRAFEDFKGPIAIGLRSGHVSHSNVTLTFGVEAELLVHKEAQLHLIEPAVTP